MVVPHTPRPGQKRRPKKAPPVQWVEVRPLQPYERNARTHSREQLDKVKDGIRRRGFYGTLVFDNRGLLVGHARREAVLELWDAGEDVCGPGGPGIAEPFPVGWAPGSDVTGLPEAERRSLILADNQLALMAGWDPALLKAELLALKGWDVDLESLGFSAGALVAFMADKGGRTDPDATPERPVAPVSTAGVVWLLGEHRLICGDSTDKAVVAELLKAERPGLMVTDPPYGVGYDPAWRTALDDLPRNLGEVPGDDRVDWEAAFQLFAGDVAYVWHSGLHGGEVQLALERAGFEMRSQIIWAKPHYAIGRGDYHWQHEPCWYAVRKGGTGHWAADRKQATLWEIDNATIATGGRTAQGEGQHGHGTQKPVEAMRRPIVNNSQPGEVVYDPFVGSGTTIIAATMEGRRCYAADYDPGYVDVAVKRWQSFTGLEAVRESDGVRFDSLLPEPKE